MRSKILSEEFGWDKEIAKKIWCFGPDTTGAPSALLRFAAPLQIEGCGPLAAALVCSSQGRVRLAAAAAAAAGAATRRSACPRTARQPTAPGFAVAPQAPTCWWT